MTNNNPPEPSDPFPSRQIPLSRSGWRAAGPCVRSPGKHGGKKKGFVFVLNRIESELRHGCKLLRVPLFLEPEVQGADRRSVLGHTQSTTVNKQW